MQWSDNAVVIASRKYGESSSIITLFTLERGNHAGLVRSAMNAKKRGIYQPGNLVDAIWKGRIAEHLGNYDCELVESIAGKLLHDPVRLTLLNAVTGLVEKSLPEREPHPDIFPKLLGVLRQLTDISCSFEKQIVYYVFFELGILSALGFGMDFTECAATGSKEALIYASPRSGRAVSREAGEPYKDKLLPLPPFLLEENPLIEGDTAYRQPPSMHDIQQAFHLTGYFLKRYVFQSHNYALPFAREQLKEMLDKEALV